MLYLQLKNTVDKVLSVIGWHSIMDVVGRGFGIKFFPSATFCSRVWCLEAGPDFLSALVIASAI